MSELIAVKKNGVTVAEVDNFFESISPKNIAHYAQFCTLIGNIKRDLSKSGNVGISIETYHELLKWNHTSGSYIRAVPVARELSELLFGYVPDERINGRQIRDINTNSPEDRTILLEYHNLNMGI
jgi:CO dehydrogenase/acetyl-CoA synthase beta subunit